MSLLDCKDITSTMYDTWSRGEWEWPGDDGGIC